MVSPSIVMTNLPHVQDSITYDYEAFDYVCQTAVNVFSINVRADSPYQSLDDLINDAKERPGELSYGHLGRYTDLHLNVYTLAYDAEVDIVDVPYRGDAASLVALLAGDVDFSLNSVISILDRDDLRPLAVMWDQRHPALPEVPTTAELGYPQFFVGQQGIFAPAGTPKEVLAKLEEACAIALEDDGFKQAAENQQAVLMYNSGADFAKAVAEDFITKGDLISTLREELEE